MRELEFRICYTAQNGEKSFIYSDNDRFLIGLNGKIYENYGKDWKTPLWEVPFDAEARVEQYTGCKDKNGKKIYEGDKLEYNIPGHGKFQGVAEFFVGNFVCAWGDQTEEPLSYMRTADLEVTGNIFGV